MIANLPLLFAGGSPTSLAKMTMHELECFITFLVHCSWGHDTAKTIHQPQWWPTDVLFSDPFGRPSTLPKDWTSKLRDLITKCYAHHNSEFLLKFSEELSQNPPSKLQYVDNCDRTTSLYERTSGKLLVTFRNENMLYDRKSEGNRKCLLPKRQVTSESVVENIIADIYLCDTCDEVFDSFEEIKQHESECTQRTETPDILCLSPEPHEEEEEIGQERFMEIMGLRHVMANVPTCTTNEISDKNLTNKHRQRRSTIVSNLSYFPFSSHTGRKFNKLRHPTEESNKREVSDRYCSAPPLCIETPRWLCKPRPHTFHVKYKKSDNYWNRYHMFPHQRKKIILDLTSYLLFRNCKPVRVKIQSISDQQIKDYLEELEKQKLAKEKERIERELAESLYDHDIEFVCVSECAKQNTANKKRQTNSKSVNRQLSVEVKSEPSNSKPMSSSNIDIIDLCSDEEELEGTENANPYPVACHASSELKSQTLSLSGSSEANNSLKDIPHLEAAYPTLIDDKTPYTSTPCANSLNSESKVFPLKEYHINSPNSIISID